MSGLQSLTKQGAQCTMHISIREYAEPGTCKAKRSGRCSCSWSRGRCVQPRALQHKIHLELILPVSGSKQAAFKLFGVWGLSTFPLCTRVLTMICFARALTIYGITATFHVDFLLLLISSADVLEKPLQRKSLRLLGYPSVSALAFTVNASSKKEAKAWENLNFCTPGNLLPFPLITGLTLSMFEPMLLQRPAHQNLQNFSCFLRLTGTSLSRVLLQN